MASLDIHGLLWAWLTTSHTRRAPAEARPGPHSPDLQGPLPGQPLLHSVQPPPLWSRGRAGPCLRMWGLAPARCPGPSAVGLSQGPPRPILRLQSPPLEAISSPKGPHILCEKDLLGPQPLPCSLQVSGTALGITCVIPAFPHRPGSPCMPRAQCLAHQRDQETEGCMVRWAHCCIYTCGHTLTWLHQHMPGLPPRAKVRNEADPQRERRSSGCRKAPWPQDLCLVSELLASTEWALGSAHCKTETRPAPCRGLGGPPGLVRAAQGGVARQSSRCCGRGQRELGKCKKTLACTAAHTEPALPRAVARWGQECGFGTLASSSVPTDNSKEPTCPCMCPHPTASWGCLSRPGLCL